MAANFPILNVPHIAEPCTQSWEQMPGTTRVRHCAACDQDVVNLAAMSAAQIARLLAGPLPCLRIARYDDGSLVTTEPVVAHALPRIAAGLLTAAMAIGAAAQNSRPQQALIGAPPVQPQVTGRITDHAGHPVTQATATLLQLGKVVATAKVGPDGAYSFSAPAGHYDLRVEAPNTIPTSAPVDLSWQKPLLLPIYLNRQAATIGKIAPPVSITMGFLTRPEKVAAPKKVQLRARPSLDLTPIK